MSLVHFRLNAIILEGEEKNKTVITMLDHPCRSPHAYFGQLLALTCSLLKIQPCWVKGGGFCHQLCTEAKQKVGLD